MGVHAPEAPSRPSVPSELRQPVSVIAPVAGSRLRITTAPKLVATLVPAVPPATYTLAPSGETATAWAPISALPTAQPEVPLSEAAGFRRDETSARAAEWPEARRLRQPLRWGRRRGP